MRGSAALRASIAPGGALAGPWVRNELWRRARAVPSLDLRFADNKSLVDATTGQNLVTFTRASSGTYVDSQGVIRTATTNLSLRSEKFDDTSQWGVTGSGATLTAATDIAAPNGTMTAWTLTSSGAAAQLQQTITGISGATYTGSFWIRRRSGTGTVNIRVAENVNTALAGVTSNWQRFSFTATSTSTTIRLGINLSGTADAVDLWGAQLEQSSTVGEYIPTTSTINSAPRFDHNPTTGESLGLLVEEARTNNVLQSEDFATTWTASNLTVTTNSVVAPDGMTTADTIAPPTDGLTATRFLRQNPVLTTQQAYTLSVFVKAGTATTNGIALYVSDSTATNNFRANFNVFNLTTSPTGTGWATPTATIIPYPNGWYRCILSGVTSTAHTGLRAVIYLSVFGNVADTYGSIHVWGAQLEAGSLPTSYIPTTTATATRSADVASISGSNFSSWYRQDEGTLYAESRQIGDILGFIAALSDGTDNNRIAQFRQTTALSSRCVRAGSATNPGSITIGSSQALVRSAIAAAANSCGAAANGVLATDSAPSALPTVDRLGIGLGAPGLSPLNGTIRRLTYWPQRLPNNVLQSITQ